MPTYPAGTKFFGMRRAFTFFEMLIVAVILATVTAVVAPSLSKSPRRLAVENALTGIRNAIDETSMRARATGKPLQLVLNIDTAAFEVKEYSSELESVKGWTPPLKQSEETERTMGVAISQNSSYSLSGMIEWHPEETGLDIGEEISFAFFEDGQASGKTLHFNIGKQ
ncbi:MAG: type II secretion system protein, partial [Victivallales bacterium]|nr:type II secretion system protein [Victivallales bacterium]